MSAIVPKKTAQLSSLLQRLKAANIRIALDQQGGLRVRSQGAIEESVVAEMKALKEPLMAWLKSQHNTVQAVDLKQKQPFTSQQVRVYYDMIAAEQQGMADPYILPMALLIDDSLSVDQLNLALQRLLQRHSALSLIVKEEQGQLWQYQQPQTYQLVAKPLALCADNRQELVAFCLQRLSKFSFAAEQTLWQAELYQLNSGEYVLYFALHHLISDGLSHQLLLQDFLKALQQDLPPTAFNYLDYAAWQQQSDFSQLLDYWQEQLKDIEPISLAKPACLVPKFARKAFHINPAGIDALCSTLAVSRFSYFYSLWAFVLSKLSGQTALVLSSPDANRRRPEWQDVVGFFANTLFLPVQIQPEASLASNLQAIHHQLQQHQAYADCPVEKLLLQRPEKAAFLDTAIHYVLGDTPSTWQHQDVSFRHIDLGLSFEKSSLSFAISDGQQLQLEINFDSQRFAPEFIDLLSTYISRAHQALLEQPQCGFQQWSLLSEQEKACLLALPFNADPSQKEYQLAAVFRHIQQANHTEKSWPYRHILSAIEQQVQQTPNAIAVSDEQNQLSYQTLWQESGQLAAALHEAVGGGQIIALCLDRSVQVSRVLLAILRSGNAYLPLNNSNPASRLLFQLENSQAALLIYQPSDTDLFAQAPCPKYTVEALPIAQQAMTITWHENTLFNLIYTSGSTGQAKGVRVLHSGIANRLQWMQAHYEISAADTVLQKTPLSFDVSVWELFLPLMAGARLHFAPPESHKDAWALQQLIAEQKIQVLHFVPSMLRLFLELNTETNHQPRLVFCSGELLTSELIEKAQKHWPNSAWHNLYGPTEASVDVSFYACQQQHEQHYSVPIGKAISNTQLHIVDQQLQPLSPFCVGEIVIGGQNLAQGYHGLAEQSAQQFIHNPYYLDGHPSLKLYKTGDLGRFLADGSIEYIARKDSQIKLRGLRIELGDIEAQALKHADIVDAAALLYEDQGEQALLLFYRAEKALNHSELRQFLRQYIAQNSMPNALVYCQDWPLNSSGKRDNKALLTSYRQQTLQLQPQQDVNAIEQVILSLWQKELKRNNIGLDDDFFALGGHSLLAGKIVAQLAQHFQRDLRLADFWQASTVRSMAEKIQTLEQMLEAIPVLPDRIPASWQQKRVLIHQQWQNNTAYHMPLALQLKGNVDCQALERVLQKSIAEHAILRCCYQFEGDEVWLKPSDKVWQLEFVHSHESEQHLLHTFNQKPFDLSQDLPLRACLVKQNEQHYLLMIVLHHIAGDARSLEILAQHWLQDYARLTQGLALEERSSEQDYRHYAVWQSRADFSQSTAYWQQQLHDAADFLPLPSQPNMHAKTDAGSQSFAIDKELSQAIKHFCQQQSLSPFVFLLSVYQLLLAKLALQDEVNVALPVSGRHKNAWQNSVGFFVNTVIIRSRQHKHPRFIDFLQQQKQCISEALQHQDVAFEDVLAALQRKRPNEYTPIAQVGFNYLDASETIPQLELGDVSLRLIDFALQHSKTDMNWIFYPQEQQFKLLIEYQHSRFCAEQMTAWFASFNELAKQALAQAETPIHLLSLYSQAHIRQQLQLHDKQSFLPLNAMQQAIVFDSVLHPDKHQNRIGFYSQFRAEIDASIWQRSLEYLCQHNDLMRSQLRFVDETPYCVVDSAENFSLQSAFRVFHHADAVDVAELVEQCLHHRWDLSQNLWRVHLHLLPQQETLFIAAFHHSIFDGVSIQHLGRLIKGNVERLLNNASLLPVRNDFADIQQQILWASDREQSWNFWQKKAQYLKPNPASAERYTQHLYYQLSEPEEQQLKALCRKYRITPALYFKSVFFLSAKYQQGLQNDAVFYEVVTGRNKATQDAIGLLFEQQPNILPSKFSGGNNHFSELVDWFKSHRKEVAANTPISLAWQKQLFPEHIPFVFNFYIMETASQFLGQEERIKHSIPPIDGAVNLVCQLENGQTVLQLLNTDTAVYVPMFWQLFLQAHQRLLAGESLLANLFLSTQKQSLLRDIYQQACPDYVFGFNQQGQRAYFDGERLHTFETLQHQGQEKIVVAAENTIEKQLLAVWQDVLGKQNISTDDDFFELGGHSLTAMRIAHRLREDYQLDLPITALFETPTIKAIADYVLDNPNPTQRLPVIEKAAEQSVYPLSFAQQRLVLLSQVQGVDSQYNISAAIDINGSMDKSALTEALNTLLQRHSALRSRIHDMQWSIAEHSNFTLAEIQLPQGVDIHTYCQQQANMPFSSFEQPLLRLELIKLDENHHVLLWVMHHLIADAKSIMVLAQELWLLYQAKVEGNTVALAKPSLDYQDYCVWQQQTQDHPELEKQLHYWQQELAQAPLLLGLPTDFPRSNNAAMPAAYHHFTLPDDVAKAVVHCAKEQGISPFMLLLTAYQLLLAKRCQQQDVCIGIPREGRPSSQLENTVGFFINALVIRNAYQENKTVSECLQAVKDKILKAFENEQVPAERVLQALQLPRDSHFMPIVQAAFNYIQAPTMHDVEHSGLKLRLLDLPASTAKFECLLTISEQNGKLLASFEYDASLFLASTIQSLAEQYNAVLSQLCNNPEQRIEQIVLEPDFAQPLSLMQRDLYVASITRPGCLDHSIGYALELPLAVDFNLWQQVHKQCLAHYPMLRARLIESSQQSLPLWAFDQQPEIEYLDWSSEKLKQQHIETRLKALVQQSYQLPEQPLIRFYLLRIHQQRFYTVLACHHMLLDGKSFSLHAYHQVTNYLALLQGETMHFAEDRFIEFIEQQQATMDSPEAFEFWREQLLSVEALQAPKQSNSSAIQLESETLSDEHWQAIEQYCRDKKTTAAIYFKALYSLLIQLYCRAEQDFILFDFNDGRGSKYQSSMGCHYYRQMHKVAIESLAGSFQDVLNRTRQTQKQAAKYQLSLQAQSQLLPKHHSSFSYNFLYMPKSGSTQGMDFNGYSYSPDFANNTDLRVQLDKGQCSLTLCYQENHFAQLHFIQRLIALSQQVLSGVESVSDFDFLLAGEKAVFQGVTSQDTGLDFHFSESTQAAIIQGDKVLSHKALAEQSNQLAQYLLTQGVEKGQRIGLCFSLEPNFFIALLAVVKLGAVYVPLDKYHPAQRLQTMIDDADISWLISSERQDLLHCQQLSLNNIDLSQWSNKAPRVSFDNEDLLYLIYTSGSTGKPKAAAIYRHNFTHLLRWYQEEYQFTSQSKALLISSIGFDLSQKNFFALLQAGGTLVLPETSHYDAAHCLRLIQQQQINVLNCAPSAFYPLLEHDTEDFSHCASLQTVLLGGEALHFSALQPWFEHYTGRLVNMYGPSECTDIATVYELPKCHQGLVPLGRPIAGVELRLINERTQQVPEGLVGEIAIAGKGVGAGYWRNKRLTQQQFICMDDKTFYRTGDLAKINAQGELIYIGRKDFQIKRYGVRIELEEIESVLKAQQIVEDTRVLQDANELIAFVKAENHDKTALQQALAESLPSPMLPSDYVFISEWPLTVHGKIDRAALLALKRESYTAEPLMPRNAVEQRLQQLWQQVLAKPVGVLDNFFALGGDSLKAVRLIPQIELEFERQLPVASLFNAQTIADLAKLLQGEQSKWSPLVALQSQGKKTPIFAFHALGGMVHSYQKLASRLANEQPLYALQAYGLEEGQQPFNDFEALLSYYCQAIQQQQKQGPYRLMGHSFGGIIALEVARKLIKQGESIEQLVLIETYMPNKLLTSLASDQLMLKAFAEQNFAISLPLLSLQALSVEQIAVQIAEQSQQHISAEMVLRSLAVVKGFKTMMQNYSPQPLDIPITLIRAEDEMNKLSKKISGLVQRKNTETLGWEKITKQLQLELIAGEHHSILQQNTLAATVLRT